MHHTVNDLQPTLDNNASLSQVLAGRPMHAYRQLHSLKQLLTHTQSVTQHGYKTETITGYKPSATSAPTVTLAT